MKRREKLELPNRADKLLLHSCCAPCSCEIMETLKINSIDTTVYFYNPNIDTEEEYNTRKAENIRFANKLGFQFFDGDYNSDFQDLQRLLSCYANEPEKGKRCTICFQYRLDSTAKFAYENKFSVFTSSLGISRWKNFEQVCACGKQSAEKYEGLIYWTYNWRKRGGSDRMESISKREEFYRQNYCGCKYSRKLTQK